VIDLIHLLNLKYIYIYITMGCFYSKNHYTYNKKNEKFNDPNDVTLKETKLAMKWLNINKSVISVEYFRKGMKVEQEHGKRYPKCNVTHNEILQTAQIALAHISEYEDYYDRLERMENEAEECWIGKQRKSLFLEDAKSNTKEIKKNKYKFLD
jgi:hypothetical protein